MKSTLTRKLQTGTAALLLFVVVGVTAAPTPARAIPVVEVGINTIQTTLSTIADNWQVLKEGVLDVAGQAAAKAAIKSILRSTINWANNGFNGSPAYVTNLRSDLQRLADFEANRFLNSMLTVAAIDSPFRDVVVTGLQIDYLRSTARDSFLRNSRYTLRDYSPNHEAFVRGDFSQGGLTAWVESWRNDQNNIIGANRAAREALNRITLEATSNRVTELNWSRGIFSWCTEPAGEEAPAAEGDTSLTQEPVGGSADCETQTAGSFLHERITDSLGADIASLVSADELDEVVAALLSGLANKILGGDGFSGLSRSSGGGLSPLDAAISPDYATSTSARTSGLVAGQISELERYKSNWTQLKNAAEQALAACEDSSRPESAEAEELARDTLSKADAAIAKVEAAIERLTEIQAKLTTGGGANATEEMRDGFQEYEEFMASDMMPTGSELVRAATQSQNLEDIEPPTLMYRLTQATRSCSIFF